MNNRGNTAMGDFEFGKIWLHSEEANKQLNDSFVFYSNQRSVSFKPQKIAAALPAKIVNA